MLSLTEYPTAPTLRLAWDESPQIRACWLGRQDSSYSLPLRLGDQSQSCGDRTAGETGQTSIPLAGLQIHCIRVSHVHLSSSSEILEGKEASRGVRVGYLGGSLLLVGPTDTKGCLQSPSNSCPLFPMEKVEFGPRLVVVKSQVLRAVSLKGSVDLNLAVVLKMMRQNVKFTWKQKCRAMTEHVFPFSPSVPCFISVLPCWPCHISVQDGENKSQFLRFLGGLRKSAQSTVGHQYMLIWKTHCGPMFHSTLQNTPQFWFILGLQRFKTKQNKKSFLGVVGQACDPRQFCF